jgi:hypothetical protein
MSQAISFRPQFTRIKDISDRRRLPRLGKIRLGIKKISQKTGKEYPSETSYFVCPPEVQKVFGEKPTEIEVMFPLNDLESIFPQRYVWFGSSRGIKCIGDGERAMRIEEPDGTRYQEMIERDCSCDLLGSGCSQRANLFVMIPKVNVGGVYQIDLGSYHSIIDINSGLDYVQALVGRFSMVPLILARVSRETHGSGKKETHYTLMVTLRGDLDFINSLRESTTRILSGRQYALPAAVIENPAFDEGAVIEIEADVKEESKDKPEKTELEETPKVRTEKPEGEEGITPAQVSALVAIRKKVGSKFDRELLETTGGAMVTDFNVLTKKEASALIVRLGK